MAESRTSADGDHDQEGLLAKLLPAAESPLFWAEHYGRMPYCGRGAAGVVGNAITQDLLVHLTEWTRCDLTMVRDGRVFPGPRPRAMRELDALHSAGYTAVFRHAERHSRRIATLGRSLALDVHGALDAHLYLTPAGRHGFGWHYDAEDVFFLHAVGTKRFLLRMNTLQRDPIPATIPKDMHCEREVSPVWECRLQPGDWLYIPRGWWHVAHAETACRSLSLGLLAPTPLDLLDALRAELLCDPAWRQRLAPCGRAVVGGGPTMLAPEAVIGPLAATLHERFGSASFLQHWLGVLRDGAERVGADLAEDHSRSPAMRE